MGDYMEGPARLVRISVAAWQSAQAMAGQPGDDGHGAGGGHPDAGSAARQELGFAGIASEDGLTDTWKQALTVVAEPQIVVRLTATYNGISGQSTLSLAGARVVCVHRRRAFESTADGGVRITGTEPAVEVSLFSTDDFWHGVRRILPPLPQLRAGAAEATSVLDADSGVDAPEALDVARKCTSQVTAELAWNVGGTPRGWAGMWALRDDQLYSIRTRRVDDRPAAVVVPVQAGHIAREIGFALTGALAAAGVRGGAA
ncbi:hypothetical protein [Arthrobacter sp. NPDC092385]|uniref:hypothetical protein n=1 Tax=Arthrobacter sp. NPDC092385 TaxID=3363943 RepID=UPI0038130459